MKEVVKDILHSDIIIKTKSTFQDLVTGVRNLFRHPDQHEEKEQTGSNPNNHLKSPDEMDADFRLFSIAETEKNQQVIISETQSISATKTEVFFKMNVINEDLPEYMEENY